MRKKNKVFFVLSLIFLSLALLCTVLAWVSGIRIGQLNRQDSSTDNAIGAVAEGILYALFLVLFSIATWAFSALTMVFSILNFHARVRWLRVTSAIFSGAAIVLSLVAAVAPLLSHG